MAEGTAQDPLERKGEEAGRGRMVKNIDGQTSENRLYAVV